MDMWVAHVNTLWESRDLSLCFIKAYSYNKNEISVIIRSNSSSTSSNSIFIFF